MIFYFTGTGNCLEQARTLATVLKEELINMAECRKQKIYDFTLPDNGNLGFVFPVYYGGLPTVVIEFVKNLNLKIGQNPYVYIAPTYGGSIGAADSDFSKLLNEKKIQLNATFGLLAPDNFIPMFNPPDEIQAEKILTVTHAEVLKTAEEVKARKNTELKSGFGGKLNKAFIYPLYKFGRKTEKFFAKDDCIFCGVCEYICPDDAISLKNGKPEWTKEQCVFCLGCINRCPVQAIQYGKGTEKKRRYVNPILK